MIFSMLPELEKKKQDQKEEKVGKGGKLLSGKHAEEVKAKEKEE